METAIPEATATTTQTTEQLFASLLGEVDSKETVQEAATVVVEEKKEGESTNENKEEKTTKEEAVEVRDRFENLTRTEKKQLEKRQKFEAEVKAFEEQKASYVPKSDLQKLAQENALELIKMFGGDPDQAIKRYLSNDGKDPAYQLDELKKEINTLKTQLTDKEQKQLETKVKDAEADQEKKISDFKTYVKDVTLKDADKYEYLAEIPNFQDEVFKAWFEIANKTGTPPDLHKVLEKMNEEAEKYLESQVKGSKAIPKLMRKLGLVPEDKKEEAQIPITLSSLLPQSAPVTEEKPDPRRIPTDKERIDAAVAAFEAARNKKA
jgi:hypothetical protein